MSADHQLMLTLPDELVDRLCEQLVELVRDQAGGLDQACRSPWLTVGEATAYLGCSRHALYRLTAARAIPFRKKTDGQGLLFRRDELDCWVEKNYSREGVNP